MFRGIMLALFLSLLAAAPIVHAEDDILPQKREIIKELLLVTDLKKNSEKTLDISFEQLKSSTLPQLLDTELKQQLGPEMLAKIQPEKMDELIKAASVRIGDKIKKGVKEKVDIGQLTEDICYSLYNKYFTEKELQAILDFYRSPAGLKAISIMPQMTADAIKSANETTNKLIIEVYFTTMKEEMPKLLDELFPGGSEDNE